MEVDISELRTVSDIRLFPEVMSKWASRLPGRVDEGEEAYIRNAPRQLEVRDTDLTTNVGTKWGPDVDMNPKSKLALRGDQ